MSVILEFSIESEDFRLGQILDGSQEMVLALERIVPIGGRIMPFVWATGEDHDTFKQQVRTHPLVEEFRALDRVEQSALYRIQWAEPPADLIQGIAQTDAVILEGRGEDQWVFRLRFPDHEALSQFHDYVVGNDIPIHVTRTYRVTETSDAADRYGLSEEQREALSIALRRGYFETPRAASLDEIAAELGISRQAVSNRIRRGNERILREVLLPSVVDRP
jgi:predicted DNA binding protein